MKVTHFHGFEDSKIIKSLQNFSLTMFYVLTWPNFQKKSRLQGLDTSKIIGRENEENVTRTRNCCCLPFSPRITIVQNLGM